jgi:hypothetical protein
LMGCSVRGRSVGRSIRRGARPRGRVLLRWGGVVGSWMDVGRNPRPCTLAQCHSRRRSPISDIQGKAWGVWVELFCFIPHHKRYPGPVSRIGLLVPHNPRTPSHSQASARRRLLCGVVQPHSPTGPWQLGAWRFGAAQLVGSTAPTVPFRVPPTRYSVV